MRVTFQDQTLYHGDFLLSWQELGDRKFDLILTDPPTGAIKEAQSWDVPPNFHVVAWVFNQVLRPNGQIAIFANFQTACEIESSFSRYFDYRFYWEWQRPSVKPRNRKRPAPDLGMILVYKLKGTNEEDVTFNKDEICERGPSYSRKGGKTQNLDPTLKNGGNLPEVYVNESGQRFPRSLLCFPNKPCMKRAERTAHPTQKPVGLLEYILTALSNPGDLVLDSFAGSGSTLMACHRLKRSGIGFELDPEYFEMANKRLVRETAQGVLV